MGRPGTEGRVYTGLNFSFSFRKTSTPEMNPGTLKIFNLSSATRRSIHELETVCIVRVGYAEAEGPVEVFRGYVATGSTSREGPNLITTLELRDGYQELRTAKFNKSYASGVNLKTIVSDVIKSLNLPLAMQNRLQTMADRKLKRGWSFNGLTKDALSDVAKLAGVEWSIQSGRLKMLKENETDVMSTIVISKNTGLIGRPARLSEIVVKEGAGSSEEKRQMGWRIESLLLPTVEPGNPVSVSSDEVHGDFKVINVEHNGELMGSTFTTTMEVVER